MSAENLDLYAFILTLLFGPLGLLYSSVIGALLLTIIAFVSFATVVGPVVCWILAVVIGDHCTYKHNKNVENLKTLVSTGKV